MKSREGFIYLIRAETGHHKIGKTKNIPERMNFFGVKLPFKWDLLKIIEVDDMHFFESWLHKYFDEYRANGEWFDFSKDDCNWPQVIIDLEGQADLWDFVSFMDTFKEARQAEG